MSVSPGDLFEIGLIVANLEEAMEQFSQAFGYTFSPILEGVLPNRDETGDSFPSFRMAVTRETPQLELVEAQPGTPLVAPAGTGLHHLGYYVDDLRRESERLSAIGCAFDRAGIADGTCPDGWVYHQMQDGTIIELVDRERAPLRKMLTEGRLPDSPWARRLVTTADGADGQRSP